MEKEKRNFKEKYINNWIFTLKDVKKLKNVLLAMDTQEVRFWSDGTWNSEKITESNINDDAVLILTKNDLEYINQDKIDNSLYNICHLIVGLEHLYVS